MDLQEQNLEMLAELMKTLQLSLKEFVKGKMHIPAYRTLYLDQMLEIMKVYTATVTDISVKL